MVTFPYGRQIIVPINLLPTEEWDSAELETNVA